MGPIALSAAMIGLASLAYAQQSGTGMVEFADRFDQAQLKKDGVALEHMLADDLVFINGTGERQGKREFIAGWTDPSETYEPLTLVDRIVIPLGPDAGMVSAETILSGTSRGKTFSSHFRYTDTFRRTKGEWQAVHVQVTRISD